MKNIKLSENSQIILGLVKGETITDELEQYLFNEIFNDILVSAYHGEQYNPNNKIFKLVYNGILIKYFTNIITIENDYWLVVNVLEIEQ